MNAGRKGSESRVRYRDRTPAVPATGDLGLGDGHEAHALRVTQRDAEAAASASGELSERERRAAPGAAPDDVQAHVARGPVGAPGHDQVVAVPTRAHVQQLG